MKITEQVHLIRKEFYVTPKVKRYVNIYLIVGKYCYLIDCGVEGSETLIKTYMESVNRKMSDIKAVFLTHSHPDHAGAAAEIKRQTGCKLYAPSGEIQWIEDVEKQFIERPIPNFFRLFSESAKVDGALCDGDIIEPEDGIIIKTMLTKGHSHGSMSYILNHQFIFTGDAIPVENDLPIFVDYNDTIKSLDRIHNLKGIQYYCPAWDDVYTKQEFQGVLKNSRTLLYTLENAVLMVEEETPDISNENKVVEVLKRANMLQFAGNPLVAQSIEAIRDFVKGNDTYS